MIQDLIIQMLAFSLLYLVIGFFYFNSEPFISKYHNFVFTFLSITCCILFCLFLIDIKDAPNSLLYYGIFTVFTIYIQNLITKFLFRKWKEKVIKPFKIDYTQLSEKELFNMLNKALTFDIFFIKYYISAKIYARLSAISSDLTYKQAYFSLSSNNLLNYWLNQHDLSSQDKKVQLNEIVQLKDSTSSKLNMESDEIELIYQALNGVITPNHPNFLIAQNHLKKWGLD